jgi:hypothetical protein
MTKVSQLLKQMTPEEQAEVETFAAFIIARRKLQKAQVFNDDVSIQELMELIEKAGSFDWLNAKEEDVYSIED